MHLGKQGARQSRPPCRSRTWSPNALQQAFRWEAGGVKEGKDRVRREEKGRRKRGWDGEGEGEEALRSGLDVEHAQ